MSHEFKLHHYVNKLMGSLGINDVPDCPGADVLTRILEKNAGSTQITQASAASSKKKMADLSENAPAFLEKYEELKSKNVKDLDSFVSLMVKIKKDPQIQRLLVHNKASSETDLMAQGDAAITAAVEAAVSNAPEHLSLKDFEKIKMELSRVATTQATQEVSEAIKKATGKDKKKHKQNSKTLSMPSWLSTRACLSKDFCSELVHDPHVIDLKDMTLLEQEACIVTDLLFCFEGISGRYIKADSLEHKHAVRNFTVDSGLDASLRELVQRMLPLCCHYSSLARFIQEQFDFQQGLVRQSLAASLRTILNDYLVLMTQLEQQQRKGKLSLQKLWFNMQSSMHTFTILNHTVTSINKGNLRGGEVLSLLHERIPSYLGDSKAQKLCLHLTKEACLPYFQILQKWIYKGIISDHYNEFLIEEDDAFKKEKLGQDFNDAYWEQKYTIRHDNTPSFLRNVASKILNTGKYLNVIRQCGRDVSSPYLGLIEYSVESRGYVERIESNFQWSSSLLLELLMKEMHLMTRLRSLKHYFMLDQGDFIVQFMDLAENELKKSMDDILLPRLDTLLELSLRTSTANVDPYKDDLKVDLLPYDLITQLFKILSIETKQEKEYHRLEPTDLHLSGLESFSFDYVVMWPVSLVLNRKRDVRGSVVVRLSVVLRHSANVSHLTQALTRYQMLFRHLFYSKHVERQLCNVWLKDKGLKRRNGSVWVRSLRSNAYALRQRMLNFVQNLEYYAMFEVIEPLWQQFEQDMATVGNVDEVLVLHNDLLNNCLKHCMLTNPRLLKILHKLMVICVTFCNFMQKLSVHLNSLDESQDDAETISNTHKNSAASSSPEGKSSNERTIATFDHNFSKHLVELLNKIVEFSVANCEQRLITFVHRLDYNGFYKKEMEKMSASRTPLSGGTPDSRASTSSNKALRI